MATPADQHLGFLIHDVARLLRTRFEQRARALGLGLTRAQWRCLAHIERNDAINQATLADILEVEPISLARLVDRLEKLGVVERRKHPTDRRMHTLHVTDTARPLLDRLHALGAATRTDALDGIPQARIDALHDTLIAIKANLTDRPDRASATEASSEASTAHG